MLGRCLECAARRRPDSFVALTRSIIMMMMMMIVMMIRWSPLLLKEGL